jgi:hypothetical protein
MRDPSWHALATALQQGQAVCLIGALFVGIAYQPFLFMLIGLQIALATQVYRRERVWRESERLAALRARRQQRGALPPTLEGQPA